MLPMMSARHFPPELDAHEVDLHVGRRVRDKRLLAGLSQEALARRVDITFQQLQKYERAYNRISAGRLYRIGRVLAEPAAYFFAGLPGQGGPAAEDAAAPFALELEIHNRETLELVRMIGAIEDPRLRGVLKALLKSLSTHPNG